VSSTDPTTPLASPEHATEAEMVLAGPPPRSRVAIIALALALVCVIPFGGLLVGAVAGANAIPAGTYASVGAALLAAGLGVVALFRTSGGRARGRGMAIAAIPVGLLAAFLQLGFGYTGYLLIRSTDQSKAALGLLKSPTDEIDAAVPKFYDSMASKQFQVAVSEERLAQWLEEIFEKHGQLQNAEKLKPPYSREAEALAFHFSGRFVNGTVPVTVVVWFDGVRPSIDDIRVRDSSPRDQATNTTEPRP